MNHIALIEEIQKRAQESRAVVTPYSFGELANMYSTNELNISPDYQRLFRWSDEKQSQFLESLLLEMPVPPLFMIQSLDETYELADGLQRMSTYLRFTGAFKTNPPQESDLLERVKEPLILSKCDIVKELNGYSYDNLPNALAIRLRRSRIDCAIVKLGSDPNLRYHIFKRLNSGGEKLSSQELRSSFTRMLNPAAVDFIVKLSQNEDFMKTINCITDNARERGFDQENVLRFFSFLYDADNFQHDIEPFLTEFFEKLAKMEYSFQELEEIFNKTFSILASQSGEETFMLDGKKQFSVLHFEGIAIATAKLIQKDVNLTDFFNKIRTLKKDPAFINVAMGGGKNTSTSFRKRISIAESFLK